jgi:hypothetical protein
MERERERNTRTYYAHKHTLFEKRSQLLHRYTDSLDT